MVLSQNRGVDSELARFFLRVPQYACGSLAARAECSPRAAIRVRIIGCACGMFSACRNTRADIWLRVRNVRVFSLALSSFPARGESASRCNGKGTFEEETITVRAPRAKECSVSPRASGMGSFAARAECSPRAAIRVRSIIGNRLPPPPIPPEVLLCTWCGRGWGGETTPWAVPVNY